MKKILILSFLSLMVSQTIVYSACQLENLGSCTVGLQGQNQTIKDKLLPDHLNQMVNPTRNTSREFKIQPHNIPEMINTDIDDDPENEETNTPYNASCQFGVCFPGTNNGSSVHP